MLKKIKIENFISHSDTILEFDRGITIFVGHNGSGKSSVIDAITFALFGEHTRSSNKNIVHRGASSGSVSLAFTVGNREYIATRETSASGQSISARLESSSDGDTENNKLLVSGERRQYGESMSAEVAKIMGLDYKKMRVAAVVQQGELNRIIESQPKEFKEFLNSLIGVDRLDTAYQSMHDVINGFREKIREKCQGYDDKYRDTIIKSISDKTVEEKKIISVLESLENKKAELLIKLSHLDKEIERMEPLLYLSKDLSSIMNSLVGYFNEKRSSLEKEILRLDNLIREASNALDILLNSEEIQFRSMMISSEIEESVSRLTTAEAESGRLRGIEECVRKLEIKEGRCPVCNSRVDSLNSLYDINRIKRETIANSKIILDVRREMAELERERKELDTKRDKITFAVNFLKLNKISGKVDLEALKRDLEEKRIQKNLIPSDIADPEKTLKLALDSYSKELIERIQIIRSRLHKFDPNYIYQLRIERKSISDNLLTLNTEIGSARKSLQQIQETLINSKTILTELENASSYLSMLEDIRTKIYNRDGFVCSSIRSYALKMISAKASDYSSMFNIGISSIELNDKARDITISCYGKQGLVDIKSLSGGERVAVALALRFAIAYLMGSHKLDFIILDEPTTHLDQERRKLLVKIISEAFGSGGGPLSQIIIITHDSDIFEDSEVDSLYRFAIAPDGSTKIIDG